LEVKKEYGGGTTEATSFLVFTGVLRLLYPFIPAYVRAILQVSGLSFEGFMLQPLTKEKNAKVVWLYELFDAILLFKLQLNIKKHQKIALFVKADPNSLALFEKHQSLVRKLLNIQDLFFVRLHETEPQDYQQELYQGISIGIKLITSTTESSKSKKLSLEELEVQYAQQGEYLHYLRTMIANIPATGVADTGPLAAKKKELEEVKERMEELLVHIQKMKIKGKK
jgi:valyl-tRNA synthetase